MLLLAHLLLRRLRLRLLAGVVRQAPLKASPAMWLFALVAQNEVLTLLAERVAAETAEVHDATILAEGLPTAIAPTRKSAVNTGALAAYVARRDVQTVVARASIAVVTLIHRFAVGAVGLSAQDAGVHLPTTRPWAHATFELTTRPAVPLEQLPWRIVEPFLVLLVPVIFCV